MIAHYIRNHSRVGAIWFFVATLLLSFVCFVSADIKNGFDLSGSLVDPNKILRGGPVKDGVPAINKPKFISGMNADFLDPDDRVIGVSIEGKSKAYPVKILNWHEIVNDRIHAELFAVTYCPLSGTGMVFSSEIKGATVKFGVSGLLYNSDVLLYDKKTESLWSQILGQAITGEFSGIKLKQLAADHTTWRKWKKMHPDTLVLSEETGFERDYDRNPYENYEKSRQLYFPVSNKIPDSYHPKEMVIGINVQGIYKAYPFAELNKSGKSNFTDIIDEKQYTVHWDNENQAGSITDSEGKEVPVIRGFWFAWYAFYPNTLVFKAGDRH